MRIDRLLDFQSYRFGLAPSEFDYGATGPHGPVLSAGRPLWRVYVDLFAPSPKLALIQSSALLQTNHYPFALLKETFPQENLRLAVHLKLLGGQSTRTAGLLWRAQNKDHYDALLLNGPDHSVQWLQMRKGQAKRLAWRAAAFDEYAWNSLEISASDRLLKVWINDSLILQTNALSPAPSGRVGLITQADTIALFDDFYIQSGEGRIQRRKMAAPMPSQPPLMHVDTLMTTQADFKSAQSQYKPGENLHWIVRVVNQDDKPIPAAVVSCEIVGPDDKTLFVAKAVSAGDGVAWFKRSLSPQASPGSYCIRLKSIQHADLAAAAYHPAANRLSQSPFELLSP